MILRLLAAAGLALVCGCASQPPAAGEPAWTAGRMSLRVAAVPGRAAQSMSSAFELRGGADSGELRLSSPLGTQLAAARWQRGSASLRTPEGEREFASLDELSREVLGESLPLAALPDWLAGRPWPGAAHELHGGGFRQLGWRVRTAELAQGSITASRDSAPAVELRVRLDRSEP